MSFKIVDLKYSNKKFSPQKLNFNVDTNEVKYLISTNHKESKHILNALSGKYDIAQGTFEIDDEERLNRSWTKRRVVSAKADGFWTRFVPKELIYYFSVKANLNAYKLLKSRYYENKYTFLSYKKSNKNINETLLKDKIDKSITNWIKTSIEVETSDLERFTNSINKRNLSMIKNEDSINSNTILSNWLKEYWRTYERIKQNRLSIIFFQSLWDKIHSINDMRFSCSCEYQAKQDKNIKSLSKFFQYKETNWIVIRELKKIDLEVSYLKNKIASEIKVLNVLTSKILQQFSKKKRSPIKKVSDLCPWIVINEKERKDFVQKQEKVIFENLTEDVLGLKIKIQEWIHSYHFKVKNNEITFGTQENFDNYKNILMNKISSVFNQVQKQVSAISIKLEIDTRKIMINSSLYSIYIKIVSMFLLGANNIVIYNMVSHLNETDRKALNVVFKNMINRETDKSIIVIDDYFTIDEFVPNSLFENSRNELKEITLREHLINKYKTVENSLGEYNKIPYTKEDKNITMLESSFVDTLGNKYKNFGFVYIDPHSISLEKKKTNSELLRVKLNVVQVPKEGNLYYKCETDDGVKLIVPSTNKYEVGEIIKVYISLSGIIKVI
ncbi:hypothetical protein [Spiroplasma endosymbiont of Othius punctulatus]|uniref:hypothetical protein n=1 Tax=Spiroplasma endosymbiont of Othius punctulatus TaxID=3066289 RepID=UPI0030CF6399